MLKGVWGILLVFQRQAIDPAFASRILPALLTCAARYRERQKEKYENQDVLRHNDCKGT